MALAISNKTIDFLQVLFEGRVHRRPARKMHVPEINFLLIHLLGNGFDTREKRTHRSLKELENGRGGKDRAHRQSGQGATAEQLTKTTPPRNMLCSRSRRHGLFDDAF